MKAIIFVCPDCKRVLHHGEWIRLNLERLLKLKAGFERFEVLGMYCNKPCGGVK